MQKFRRVLDFFSPPRSDANEAENILVVSPVSESTETNSLTYPSSLEAQSTIVTAKSVTSSENEASEEDTSQSWTPILGFSDIRSSSLDREVKLYAKNRGILLASSATYFESGKKDLMKERQVKYKVFYCKGRRTECPFYVRYAWDPFTRRYVIKKANLEHNHSPDTIQRNGKNYIQFQSQLSPEKKHLIRSFGPSGLSGHHVKLFLSQKYPSLHFDSELLCRQLRLGRDEFRGGLQSNLSQVFQLGLDNIKSGGSFQMYHDDGTENLSLSGLVFQTSGQKKMLGIYGDLVQIDSTHKLSKYILKTSLPLGIDCLGKSIVFGIQFYTSESELHVKKGMEVMGINKRGSTLMSDGAAAFENAAKEYGMNQIRCLKHFRKQQMEARLSMKDFIADEFAKDTEELLRGIYPSEEMLNQQINSMLEKYDDVGTPRALHFLKTIKEKQKQLCYFHTSKVFSAGHSTTQRIESLHNVVKGGGTLKRTLVKYDLLTLMRHLIHYQEQKELELVQL